MTDAIFRIGYLWCQITGRLGYPSFMFMADVESWTIDSFGTTHLVGLGCCILVAGQLVFAVHAGVI
jgi:hypothetical protein